jgi:hypothetical protein
MYNRFVLPTDSRLVNIELSSIAEICQRRRRPVRTTQLAVFLRRSMHRNIGFDNGHRSHFLKGGQSGTGEAWWVLLSA